MQWMKKAVEEAGDHTTREQVILALKVNQAMADNDEDVEIFRKVLED